MFLWLLAVWCCIPSVCRVMVFSMCNDGASMKDVGAVTAKKKLKKKNIPYHHSCGVWVTSLEVAGFMAWVIFGSLISPMYVQCW